MNPNDKSLNLYTEASIEKRIDAPHSRKPDRMRSTVVHKYGIGQSLYLCQVSSGTETKQDVFRVVKLLPADNGDYQYRLKSIRDGHERVARESLLNVVTGIGSRPI